MLATRVATTADLANVASVTVVDPHTVQYNLTNPDSSFPYVLIGGAGAVINPKVLAAGTDLSKGAANAGSTPFEVADFVPNQKEFFQRRPKFKYWNPNAFLYDRVEITAVTSDPTTISGLQTDQFDLGRVETPVAQIKQQLPGFDITTIPADAIPAVYINPTQVPDENVRQAMATGMDRKSIAKAVPVCAEYDPQLTGKGSPGYVPGYDPYKFSTSKAKTLLKGATPTIDALSWSTLQASTISATAAQQQLKDAGITLNVTPGDVTSIITRWRLGNTQAAFQQFSPRPDLAATMNTLFNGPNQVASPDFQATIKAKIDAANALPLGSKERTAALEDLQKTGVDYATVLPICNVFTTFVSNKSIDGVDTDQLGWASLHSLKYVVKKKGA
jgi:ABC-type transport system substrate-binding protein